MCWWIPYKHEENLGYCLVQPQNTVNNFIYILCNLDNPIYDSELKQYYSRGSFLRAFKSNIPVLRCLKESVPWPNWVVAAGLTNLCLSEVNYSKVLILYDLPCFECYYTYIFKYSWSSGSKKQWFFVCVIQLKMYSHLSWQQICFSLFLFLKKPVCGKPGG